MRKHEKLGRLKDGLSDYGVFAAAAAVVVVFTQAVGGHTVELYGPHVAAELLGVFLTLVFVERIVRRQRERELAPLRAQVSRRLPPTLQQLAHLQAQMYKAAAEPGSEQFDDTAALQQGWLEQAQRLNFYSGGPSFPPASWATFCAHEVRTIDSHLVDVTDRFPEALGTNMLAAIERVLTSPVFTTLRDVDRVQQADNVDRGGVFLVLGDREQPAIEERREASAAFEALFVAFGQFQRAPKLSIVPRVWDVDVAPDWGSARFDGEPGPLQVLGMGPMAGMPRHGADR